MTTYLWITENVGYPVSVRLSPMFVCKLFYVLFCKCENMCKSMSKGMISFYHYSFDYIICDYYV